MAAGFRRGWDPDGAGPCRNHKSMTTHADHRVWQDVYRPMTEVGEVYLKLTVIEEVLIVSFKER